MQVGDLGLDPARAAEVVAAWDAWRSSGPCVVVFRDWRAALGASYATGLQVVLTTAAHPTAFEGLGLETGAAPPRFLDRGETRRLARLCSFSDNSLLGKVGLFVVFVDADLRVVRCASNPLCISLACTPVALVCPWWPGDALVDALEPLLGRRMFVCSHSPLAAVPAVQRTMHPSEVNGIHKRLVMPHVNSGNSTAALGALLKCRNLGITARLAGVLKNVTNAVCIVESTHMRDFCRGRSTHVFILDAILSGCFVVPVALLDQPVAIVFVTECLIEYHERIVYNVLCGAGLRVASVESHTWTLDRGSARVEGWAVAPPPDLVQEALRKLLE